MNHPRGRAHDQVRRFLDTLEREGERTRLAAVLSAARPGLICVPTGAVVQPAQTEMKMPATGVKPAAGVIRPNPSGGSGDRAESALMWSDRPR